MLTTLTLGLILVSLFVVCGEEEDTRPEGFNILSGVITESCTLTADTFWILRGGVFIGDDVNETVLYIEPGTVIYGESNTMGMLVIARGSKIMAEGTATDPIVMTSDKAVGSRSRADWGGLIINGRAPLNTADSALGEGGTGWYGGTNPSDNSGVLNYVRVEFAGRELSPDNELNGIAFQGVGSGTEVDYVQVHMNKDDGIEFFGGTCNIKHALVTGVDDDCFDWTDGWTGKAQFIVLEQYDDGGDNGFEADNNADNLGATPFSNPTISNFTIIGSAASSYSDLGALLREGTKGKLYNGIITSFNEAGLDIDHGQTWTNVGDGSLVMGSVIISAPTGNFFVEDGDTASGYWVGSTFLSTWANNDTTSQSVVSGYLPAGPATSVPWTNPSDGFFETVTYIGGVDPANDWTQGWTISDPN